MYTMHTVGSKIIRALEIIRVKNSYLMVFFEKNVCQVMNLRLYIVYNKNELIKLVDKPKKNRKYFRNCSNDFAVDCSIVEICRKMSCLL